MQQPYQPNHAPRTPQSQEQPRPRPHGRARRIFRGYLMTVGAIATICGIVLMLVRLFVEIGKWM